MSVKDNKEKERTRSSEKKTTVQEEAQIKMIKRKKENSLIKKIVTSIILIGTLLLLIVGFYGYRYVKDALNPADVSNTEQVEIEIPSGTSTKGIAQILEDNEIIKNATVFNYYLKTKNASDFQAGFYELSAAMELDDIIATLEKGGTSAPVSSDNKIIVREGNTVKEIASEIAEKTDYSEEDFLEFVNDSAFLETMKAKYPELLTEAVENVDTRYKLEGYLFPATYDLLQEDTLEMIVEKMLAKANEIILPYADQIKSAGYTVHQVLTLASLIEKEGVTLEDRAKISSVFFNRLAIEMPLQSDISVLYALDEHKEFVSIEDTQVDSPYNLYKNAGFGPGPFNSPSQMAVEAVLNPAQTDYFYFVADTSTGTVYFSETFEEHLELQEEYVDSE